MNSRSESRGLMGLPDDSAELFKIRYVPSSLICLYVFTQPRLGLG